ncbi:hypothetical protein D3C71_2173380 [compost metagenome]
MRRLGKLHQGFGLIGLGRRHGQRPAIGHQVMRILDHVMAKPLAAERAGGQLPVERQLQGGFKQVRVGLP